jgi:Zn-dependent protease
VILRYFPIIGDEPLAFVILLAAFVTSLMVGLIFHEFCHAFVADSLGDRTPRLLGRLTLNPKAHYDPLGTTLIFFAGFGWAKPVPVNPNYTRNPRQSMMFIAVAGPLSNLVMAGLAGIPIRLGLVPFEHPFIHPAFVHAAAEYWTSSPANLLGLFLGTVVVLNVLLAVFNMLPIPPLDGSRVLHGLLPPDLARQYAKVEPWGMGILLLIVFAPFITQGAFSLLTIIGPVIDVLLGVFVGDSGSLRFG